MDKRTIVFVLLVGIVFFGLNLFFSKQRDQNARIELGQKQAKQEKEKVLKQASLESRTAKVSDLPLLNIYASQDNSSFLAKGILVDHSILTLAWNDKLPDTVYVEGEAKTKVTTHPVKNGPVVFAGKNFQTLPIATLPEIGDFDVQLVTFSEGTVSVTLGEMHNGELSIPAGPLSENAIALYKTTSGWLPAGFYEAQGNAFINLQNLPLLSNLVKPTGFTQKVSPEDKKQRYYVLENAYMQLVFSNVGGSLVEINLPFKSDTHPLSVVKEIGFDRTIGEDYPANAHFPLHPYYTPNSKEEQTPTKIGGYYPLLRRGISNNTKTDIAPQYYSTNLVSDYPEMAELIYKPVLFTDSKIVFEAVQPHRKIIKTYTLPQGEKIAPYTFDLSIQIDGDSRGLWLTSGVPEVEIMSNSSSPQVQYRINRKGKSEVEKLDLPKVKEVVSISSISPDWVSNSNGYLGMVMNPLTDIGAGYKVSAIPGNKVPTRLSVIDPQYHPYPATKYPGYEVLLPLSSRGGSSHFRVYSGPFEESVLKAVDKIYQDPATGYNPDYIANISFYGWFSFISEPFAKLLFVVMKFFYNVTGSWAFAIILLTLFLRILLYPLNAWSIKSMRRMQLLSPQIQEIQKKNKKDPKKSQMEIMALYREKKVNPFTGCVPILIQIPFLIGMFDLLKSSFQLRGATFIPGWIDDLTAPDVLFQWSRPIFFIGNQFHLLPILLGAVMFIQQRLSSTAPKDPSQMTDQQRQQKAMGTIMTVVFTVMFYHFPSGLNLYWLSSMLLGILQQWITNKVLDKKKDQPEKVSNEKEKKLKSL